MRILRNLHSIDAQHTACVATIGNFDGLHLGHQHILTGLRRKANELQLPLTIVSFEPLPAEYFMPNPHARIYPFRDKVRMMRAIGVDNFLCLRFDANLANMPPEKFIEDILLLHLRVKHLVVGDDFRFGKDREGDFAMLQTMGEQNEMQVVDTPTYEADGARVSSTRIREALELGDIEIANKLMGHSYQLSGRIRHGNKRGRTIGFPTLNMKMPENIAPRKGVYAVKVHGIQPQALAGVANLGMRPTFNGNENRLETHVFDFTDSIYGSYVCIELVKFIRAEQRFDNFELLKQQIKTDAKAARAIVC